MDVQGQLIFLKVLKLNFRKRIFVKWLIIIFQYHLQIEIFRWCGCGDYRCESCNCEDAPLCSGMFHYMKKMFMMAYSRYEKKKNLTSQQSQLFLDCKPISNVRGRCGPDFGGRCNKSFNDTVFLYCNTANGWCGNTDNHKNAQPGDEYDWVSSACTRL